MIIARAQRRHVTGTADEVGGSTSGAEERGGRENRRGARDGGGRETCIDRRLAAGQRDGVDGFTRVGAKAVIGNVGECRAVERNVGLVINAVGQQNRSATAPVIHGQRPAHADIDAGGA